MRLWLALWCLLAISAHAEVDWDSLSRSVVKIQAEKTPDDTGVGIVIEEDPGFLRVLTAKHVVEGARRIWVYFAWDRFKRIEARVFGQASSSLDLAVLEVVNAPSPPTPKGFAQFSIAESSKVRRTEGVWTLYSDGTPVPNTILRLNHDGDTQQFEYTRSGLDDGYSGAPIFDKQGVLVGIHKGGAAGGNFAIGVKAQSARDVLVDGLGHRASKLSEASPSASLPVASNQIRSDAMDSIQKFARALTLYQEKRYGEASVIFQESASEGNADAMNYLGYMYEHGLGLPQDFRKSIQLYETAASAGNASALNNLGFIYNYGHGVPRDYQKARQYYERAANSGSVDARNNLGFMYDYGHGVTQDFAKARELYQSSADAGNARAMNNLGVMYYNSRGVPKDYARAKELFEKAARDGIASAMFNIGLMYEEGRGVAENRDQALAWFRKAAAAGDEDATQHLNELGK